MSKFLALLSIALSALSVVDAAADLPPIPADKSTPIHQRLALKGPNSIAVGWNTYEQLTKPCVSYGTTAKSLTQTTCSTSASSITYDSSRTWANSVTLKGLKAATTYYYKIQSTNSTTGQFFSGRSAGDKTPFTMNAVIDLGVYGRDGYTINNDMSKRDLIPTVDPSLNHTTIGRLASTINDYEFIVHSGDFAYADDWYLKADNLLDGKNAYEAILENFYTQLAPISGRKPYMVSPGNHEADCTEVLYHQGVCPDGQSNFTDFHVRFENNMPTVFDSKSSNTTAMKNANTAKALSNPPFWYSFEYGQVHVTMINTETDFDSAPDGPDGSAMLDGGPFGKPGQQLAFLEADLASVDRSVTPWLIVAGHRPWYSTGTSDNICTPCQAAFEKTLYKHGVDVAIFGHVHNAQAFKPVYNGTADPAGFNNPKAPYYLVAGGAGNIEGLSTVGTMPSYTDYAYADDYTYATLSFVNKTNLNVGFIRSSTGQQLYSQTLYKAHTTKFVSQ